MTAVIQTGDNLFGTAVWIVDPVAGSGTQTTIQAAVTAASSGQTIFIRPGTYTENVTLKAGVNLSAFGTDSSLNGTGVVIIAGTCTLTTAGSVTISGIQLQTNSAALLAVTGSAASIVNLQNCYLNCTNNTGITFSSSSASAQININRCEGNLGTTGIAYFSDSSVGRTLILNCNLSNTGASTTASTKSAGQLIINGSIFSNAINYSSSNTASSIFYSNLDINSLNTINLTTSGTGTMTVVGSYFASGTASAISVGTGTVVTCSLSTIISTNTNAVTGAGTFNYLGLSFMSTSQTINVTTQSIAGTLKGSTTTAPTVGCLGEQISSYNGSGSSGSTSVVNLTSISLTPGVWDISAGVLFSFSGAYTFCQMGISTTSATLPNRGGDNYAIDNRGGATSNVTLCLAAYRAVIPVTTTYYLVCETTFTTGSNVLQGRISGTRVG